jgi:type IV secretory pathway VirB10-like protein
MAGRPQKHMTYDERRALQLLAFNAGSLCAMRAAAAAACSGGASTRFLSDPKRPVVAALITRLRSDLPGQITAQVTQARRRRSF